MHEARARVEVEHLEPALAEHEAGHTNSAVSDRNERRASPRRSAPTISSPPKTSSTVVEAHRARVCAARSRGGGPRTTCGSPCSASRRPGRTRTAPAAAIWSRRTATAVLLDCGNGVFAKLRALRRLRGRRRGRDLAPARRPLPRPRAVRLRAHLRAAPAAGAGRRLAGHRPPGPPALHAPPGAPRAVPPRGRRVGQRGPDRERVRRCASTTRATRSSSAPLRVRFQPVPHFIADQRGRVRRRRRRPLHLRRRLRARTTSSCEFARDTDLLLIEATLPRPERDGPARPPDARRGRRARPPRRARGALVLTHFSDELDADWARARGRARRSAAPVEVAREGAVYDV